MSKANQDKPKGFYGFPGMLTTLFIGLKLTGHIDWSWEWVLAPAWIYTVLKIIEAEVERSKNEEND